MSLLKEWIGRIGSGRNTKHRWMTGEVRELINQGKLEDAKRAVEELHPELKNREAKVLGLLGEIAFRERRDTDAEQSFREALELDAGLPDAHYGLSLVMHARRDLEAALRHAQFAINRDRKQARYHAQLGLCHLELLNYGRAEMALMAATRLAPEDKYAWNNLGIAQRARANLRGAAKSFRQCLKLDPAYGPAQSNLAQLEADLTKMGHTWDDLKSSAPDAPAPADADIRVVREAETAGRLDEATALCESLLVERCEDSAIAIELGRLYRSNGDPQSGIDVLRAFLATHPEDIEATIALGKLLAGEHEYKMAEPLLVAGLEARPDDPELLHDLADIKSEQDRIEEAGALYDRAYALAPTIENRARLVASLIARCRYEDGLAHVDALLKERPWMSEDLVGFQVYALTNLGRHEELLPLLDRAIADRPHDPNRRFPRAAVHLLNERFELGWDDYRFRNLASTRHLRMLPFPEWQGEPLEGKTVVVLAEQGLGDQVMFSSCLPDLLAQKPQKVWVEAIDRVAPTIARSFPHCEIVATNQKNQLEWVKRVGAADFFVPMGDLPRHFRRSRDQFPKHRGYLVADPERVVHWQRTLNPHGSDGRPRIGFSWRGGTEATRKVLRTVDVTTFDTLIREVDARWVCLQYGDVTEDLARARSLGMAVDYWPESIQDLDEFAALIAALDLVITVCNTTVHYAGGLGKPTWVLVPHVPEWRYGLTTRSLPWYPSSVIYRQPDHGDWTAVFASVAQDLSEWCSQRTVA